MWPLSSKGGGGKALVAGPLKKRALFFAASLAALVIKICEYFLLTQSCLANYLKGNHEVYPRSPIFIVKWARLLELIFVFRFFNMFPVGC